MTVKEQRGQILREMSELREAHYAYMRLESKLELLKRDCKHESAYWTGRQTSDDFEGRYYDVILCPDCLKTWEERCYCGKHEYARREETKDKVTTGE